MTFEDLNLSKPLLTAIEELGYLAPTTIQQKAFSVIMSGKSVCGIAQTGTGKTMAYLLPILRLHTYSKERFPQTLILVPTRELVVQVVEAAKKLAAHMPALQIVGAYGGVNMKQQIPLIEAGCDIVVATPGRLLDLVYHGSLKLKAIKKLVIDEVDEMFNLGFRTQLNNIMEALPVKRQNILLSATMTYEVNILIDSYFENVETIEAAPTGTPLSNISQSAYMVPNFNTKVNLLELLVSDDEMSKVLLFAATKELANKLYERLSERFPEKVGVIHSNKEQNNRFNTVKQFHEGNYKILIATDIIARGLDVSEVSHVINFDTPEVPEDYIHRIGRTGRADKKGISIIFITEKEQEQQEAIEKLMKYKIPVQPLPEELEISDVLTDDEMPKVFMHETLVKPVIYEGGGAFHEKSAKNMKTNNKVRYSDKMKAKYGKPKKRPKKS